MGLLECQDVGGDLQRRKLHLGHRPVADVPGADPQLRLGAEAPLHPRKGVTSHRP